MKIHQLSVDDALRSLHTRPEGLTSVEAQHRLQEFGPNQVERIRGEPLWLQFLKEFTHFFAVILWVAAALAFFADWNEPGQGMGALGGAIVGVIVINGVFSFWQVYRAERALSALEKLLPHQVRVLRDGAFELRPAAELVPGDVIALEAGDYLPADCRLIEAFAVRVNNATVTGESVPLVREAAPCGCEDELHSRNVLLAGTIVVSGNARAVVFATGMHTEFGKIAHLTQTTREIVVSPSARDRVCQPGRRRALGRAGGRLLSHRAGDRPAVLGQLHLRDRDHRGERARGAAADGDAVAGHGRPADGSAERPDPAPARRRDPGLGHRDLHRQDRDPDREPDARRGGCTGGRAARSDRRRKESPSWAGGFLGSSRVLGCVRTSRPPRITARPSSSAIRPRSRWSS